MVGSWKDVFLIKTVRLIFGDIRKFSGGVDFKPALLDLIRKKDGVLTFVFVAEIDVPAIIVETGGFV